MDARRRIGVDVLKNYISLSLSISISISTPLLASPPVDLVYDQAPASKKKALGADDLVYTDIRQPVPDAKKDLGKMKSALLGRSRPGRVGKAMLKLRKGEAVFVHKLSLDGRWFGIESLRARQKVWVPRNSVSLPEPLRKKFAEELRKRQEVTRAELQKKKEAAMLKKQQADAEKAKSNPQPPPIESMETPDSVGGLPPPDPSQLNR